MLIYIREISVDEISEPDVKEYIIAAARNANKVYGDKYDLTKFDAYRYLIRGRLTVCYRDDKIIGLMACRLTSQLWDYTRVMCIQDLLYCTSPRAVKYLLDDFIDFGKTHADDIITMIGAKTNIKARSLEKLGFKKLEELYRIEV